MKIERDLDLRPEVRAFAQLMEARLRDKDHARGGNSWKRGTIPLVLAQEAEKRIRRTVAGVGMTSTGPRLNGGYDRDSAIATAQVAADAANFAMMAIDLLGGLPIRPAEVA